MSDIAETWLQNLWQDVIFQVFFTYHLRRKTSGTRSNAQSIENS